MYEFKTEPFDHQRRIFQDTRETAAYGLLWEQGTGKTKPAIDTAAWLFEQGKIDGVIVVAPNGVHRNWVTDEIPVHLPDRLAPRTHSMFWRTQSMNTKWHHADFEALLRHQGLTFFCINYDGFMTKLGKKSVWRFLNRRRCLYILDESHHIKTPAAKRTRSIVASGRYGSYRRVLTGTPGDKPFDIYSQLRFLDPDIWKRRQMASFSAFKQHYGEWFTRSEAKEVLGYDPGYDKLLRYKNLDELAATLASVSDRVLKEDVLDLPPKLFSRRQFDMTQKQRGMYEQLRTQLELELESGLVIDGSMAIVRLLRLQQIACGYAVADREEPVEMCDKRNPRLDATLEHLESLNHPAIVWARFTLDVEQLVDALGERAVRYDGRISDDEAERSKKAFQAGDAQFFVGNPAKGSEGLTLNQAKTVMFYSNSFKLLERLQAEDRCHRYGQDGTEHEGVGHGVHYLDLCACETVDEHIISSLKDKYDIAAQINGDKLREWI